MKRRDAENAEVKGAARSFAPEGSAWVARAGAPRIQIKKAIALEGPMYRAKTNTGPSGAIKLGCLLSLVLFVFAELLLGLNFMF